MCNYFFALTLKKENGMKKVYLYLSCYLFLILLPVDVSAAGSHTLTLNKAIAIALRDSPLLQARKLELTGAIEGEKASKGELFPRLDAYAGYQRTSDPVVVVPIKGFNAAPPVFSRDHYQTGLTFSFLLYEGGRNWTRITSSKLAKTIAGKNLKFSQNKSAEFPGIYAGQKSLAAPEIKTPFDYKTFMRRSLTGHFFVFSS